MGSNSYFAAGEWNFTCDLCGKTGKSSDARKTWDGFYVCSVHKEVRNPQDFVRGKGEDQALPWSRPKSGDPVYIFWINAQGTAIGFESTGGRPAIWSQP